MSDLIKPPEWHAKKEGKPMSDLVVTKETIDPVLGMIERAARDPNVDICKMQALLDMQERILKKNAEAEFAQAFTRLSSKLPAIKRSSDVVIKGQKQYSFARWEDISRQINPLLEEEGFALSFDTQPRLGDGGGLIVTGTLMHSAGHSRQASIPLPLDMTGSKNGVQGYGSTLSYGKRYTATMLLNIVTEEDDDGVRGGARFVTPAQVEELRELLAETKSDVSAYMQRVAGVESLEDIPADRFLGCKNALLAKKAKMAGAA